jgi:hypothetical protein
VITKQKKVLYSITLVISTGLFANEIVNATERETPPEPIERPAEDPALTTPVGVPSPASGGQAATGATEPTAPAARSATANDPIAALEAALARLSEPPSPTGTEGPAFGPGRLERRAAPAPMEVVEAPLGKPPEDLTRARRADRLEQLLQSHALAGVVNGPAGAVALIGGRAVRVGDLLVDGDARVLECTPAGLRIEFEGESAWIALPGLRTHAPAPRAQAAAAAPPPPPVKAKASSAEPADANEGGQS